MPLILDGPYVRSENDASAVPAAIFEPDSGSICRKASSASTRETRHPAPLTELHRNSLGDRRVRSPRSPSLSQQRDNRPDAPGHEVEPMEALHQRILSFFPAHLDNEGRTKIASAKFNAIRSTVSNNHWTATKSETEQVRRKQIYGGGSYSVSRENTCWSVCYSAASLVMVLAAPQLRANEALLFPGHDTRDEIELKRSACVRDELMDARATAQATNETSVLCVGLLDNTDQSRHYNLRYAHFSHWFVIVVAPEGFRLYQAWYEHFTLADWLDRGEARLRTWDEFDRMLEMFDVLHTPQDEWTDQINSAYKACFDVDVAEYRRQMPSGKATTPESFKCTYHPFFTVQRLDHVKVSDVNKFQWECNQHGDFDLNNSSPAHPRVVKSGPFKRSGGSGSPSRSHRRSSDVAPNAMPSSKPSAASRKLMERMMG